MKKILIIGDSHTTVGVSNDRFEWLGHLIVDEKPDIIVNIGDFSDMTSLSLFDVGKKSYEGRRYRLDVEATIDAQERLFEPITKHNRSLKAKHEKQYKPRLVFTLGNHCNRINRAINDDPKLEGTISIDDLQYEEFGWEVYPFKEIVDVEGVFFTHYFTSGLMDRPIGGVNLGQSILTKVHGNALQGHTHHLNLAWSTLPNGRKILGGSVGCYFDHAVDYVTARAQSEWAKGILTLNVEDKEVQDYSWLSLKTIRNRYA